MDKYNRKIDIFYAIIKLVYEMINIVFSGNYKVFDGIMINLLSLIKHTRTPVCVYVLTMDLKKYNKDFIPITMKQVYFLEEILKEVNSNSKVTKIDLTEKFLKDYEDSYVLKSEFTPYALLRLYIDVIDKMPNKVIYLDTDTIINNDINELYNIDISKYELGVVKDLFNWFYIYRWKYCKNNGNYFNSGVLLINVEKIKETKLFTLAREFLKIHRRHYMDQDALNFLVKNKLMLPERFNAKDKYYDEIVVHHFCNVRKKGNWFHRTKPWEVKLVKERMHAYDDILDKYIELKRKIDSNEVK